MQHGEQSPGITSFAIAPQHPTTLRGPLDLMTAMPGNGFDILVASRRSIGSLKLPRTRSISRDDQEEMHFDSRFDPGD